MSSRRARVPGTYADRQRRIIAVAREHIGAPGVYRVAVQHDDDCPTLRTQSLRDCTCSPSVKPPTLWLP